jgi:hypothetical protein
MTVDATVDIGDRKYLQSTFKDVDGVLTDPTTVVCRILPPDGTETSGTPVTASTGIWRTPITFDDDGFWQIRIEGTGDVVAAAEYRVRCRTSIFYPPPP